MQISARIKLLRISFGVLTLRQMDAGEAEEAAKEKAREILRSATLANPHLEKWERERILEVLPLFLFDAEAHYHLCEEELRALERVAEKKGSAKDAQKVVAIVRGYTNRARGFFRSSQERKNAKTHARQILDTEQVRRLFQGKVQQLQFQNGKPNATPSLVTIGIARVWVISRVKKTTGKETRDQLIAFAESLSANDVTSTASVETSAETAA